jgi:ubiquinone biosynthesis protein
MTQLFRLIQIFWIINVYFYFSRQTRAVAFRQTLEKLGPIFVKFGQALSMRKDIVPEEIADELAKLQDQVPPFSAEHFRHKFEKTFKEFNLTPLASASIAQVHEAVLRNDKQVIVKILRPRIRKRLKSDIALMYFLAHLGGKRAKQFKAKEIIAEFEISILGELDLLREAASASQLRRNFLHSHELYVPEIYWEYTTHDMLVMEKIHGIPIRHKEKLLVHGINLKKLAERTIEVFFTQVFRDSFFHADMHAGNVFVEDKHPEDPRQIVVDFGVMGTLSPRDQRYIAENFLAFFKRDYRRVAMLHVESGWAPPETRVDHLEMAIRSVCEPIFEKPLGEISFGQLLLRLIQMASQFDIQIQPQLVLLQKTLLSVEGLARYLYPELDLWKTAKPFLERWVRKQIGVEAFLRKIKEYAPLWFEQLPEWPHLVYRILEKISK